MTLYYKDFDNKTVVITGGASGLGKGAAKVFAKYDANIVLVDIDREKLDLVRNEISQNGFCLLYTSPSPRDGLLSRMPSSA